MRLRWPICASAAALTLAVCAGASAQTPSPSPPGAVAPPAVPAPRGSVAAGALDGSIRLDGTLDEPAWQQASFIDNLTMSEPTPGAAPTGRTIVRVLADRKALVIGVRCEDADPAGIVSFTKARDGSLQNEDHVKVVLDTFQDGRSGYVFAVNPGGARYDALVEPGGETENANWDGLWEAATSRDAGGWSLEIRIPVTTLSFRKGASSWNFNVQRRIQRLQETDRWSGWSRDYKVTQTSRAGELTGLPDFDLGVGLTVRPAVTTGGGDPRAGRRRGRLVPAEPRRHAAPRLEPPGLAHGQHRLRRDRGRHAAHEPDALPAVLPGEAHVLPGGVRHLRIRPGPGHRDAAVLQPAHRAGGGARGADSRRRQGERPRGRHQPRRAGREHERRRRRRAGRHDGRGAGEAERAGRVVRRRDRHRRRPPRARGQLARSAATPPIRRPG